MIIKLAVGLDVSSKKINACLVSIDEKQVVKVVSSKVISNSQSGFKDLVIWMNMHHSKFDCPLVVTMEATGIYHELCALYLHEERCNVSVVLPNKAKKYLQALGIKSKNDKIDAKGLARMAAEQSLQSWSPLSKFFYKLRLITRQHQNLQETKTILNNQVKALQHCMYRDKGIEKQLQDLMKKIDKQIEEIEERIKVHIAENEEVCQKVKNICEIKGVGILTVATVLAETNGFALFENTRQLMSYAGYDVVENESGKHTGKTKISKKGNTKIRRCLFLPAFNVVRLKVKSFEDFYKRNLPKHNIKMKTYTAIQKKLLVTFYGIYKGDVKFDPLYMQKKQTEEQEQMPVSLHNSEGVIRAKNSPANSKATQGKQTVELSQLAASLQ